jgi:hypothetical protein
MLITTPTNTEVAAGSASGHLSDDYSIVIRQLRNTQVFLSGEILTELSGAPTQTTANKIVQHIDVVHLRANAVNSITNKSVGQQTNARNEHNDQAYAFDSNIASINGDFQSLWSIASDVIAVYEPETLLTVGEIQSLTLNVNAILANY